MLNEWTAINAMLQNTQMKLK